MSEKWATANIYTCISLCMWYSDWLLEMSTVSAKLSMYVEGTFLSVKLVWCHIWTKLQSMNQPECFIDKTDCMYAPWDQEWLTHYICTEEIGWSVLTPKHNKIAYGLGQKNLSTTHQLPNKKLLYFSCLLSSLYVLASPLTGNRRWIYYR